MKEKIQNWEYHASVDLSKQIMYLAIIPEPKVDKPDNLVKYYSISKNSIEALTKGYLFASHPYQLNDPFDCFESILNFNDIPLDMCIRFLSLWGLQKDKVIDSYNKEKVALMKDIKRLFYDFTYAKMGIVSMTEDSLNMQMWTHYAKHDGFQIIFQVNKLPKVLHGPFPIHYVKSVMSLNFSDNVYIAALYQTNVKSDTWEKKKEWRFIAESFEPMKLPNRPELWEQQKDRKVNYDISAIKEIVLGFLFFHSDYCINDNNGEYQFDFQKHDNKVLICQVLDFVINNFQIPVYLIQLINNLNFNLIKLPIDIEKLDDSKYKYKKHVA